MTCNKTFLSLSTVVALATGCAGDDGDSGRYGAEDDPGISMDPDGDPDDTEATGSEPDDESETEEPEEPEEPLFDVGGEDPDSRGDEGCTGIDFLFVIDNSGSMVDNQLSLVSSFPGFISAIEATLGEKAEDFHVMVVDTDDGSGKHPDAEVGTCDAELGAGLVSDPGYFPCGVPDDRRYLTDTDDNLPSAFGCIAFLGSGGDASERPMEAMQRSVADLAQPQACNEGFLREDNILVVTVITDEDDAASPGGAEQWIDTLLAAKGGDMGGIVMLGLMLDGDSPAPLCGPELAPSLTGFVDQFGDHGLRGSVCAEDYSPFFEDAVDVIDQACSDFEPPG